MKKIPMRKCVATNESLPKKELIRIVRTPKTQRPRSLSETQCRGAGGCDEEKITGTFSGM